jgi:hypothetical protein
MKLDEEYLIQNASLASSTLASAVQHGITLSFEQALPGMHGSGGAASSFGGMSAFGYPSSIMWVAELGRDRAALADLGVVLYTHLAWMAQLVHGQRNRQTAAAAAAGGGGGSRSSRQQQQQRRRQPQQQQQVAAHVPAWHEEFLAAVHAPPCPGELHDPANVVGQMMYALYQVSMYLDITRSFGEALGVSGQPPQPLSFGLGRLDGSHSGIESKLPVRESLLLLLEVMLLDDMHSTRMHSFKRVAALLGRLESGSDADAAAAAATADALLQPVLHQLAPAVMSTLAAAASSSSSSAAAAAARADPAADAAALSVEFAWLVESLVTSGKHLGSIGLLAAKIALLLPVRQSPGTLTRV